ncbi:MAG: acyl-CoA desaturase [Bryobacteraceae bacterium]
MTGAADPDKLHLLRSSPFFVLHASLLLPIWVGVSPAAIAACVALYYVKMFGITAAYHRYLAHASFKTGRLFQFVLVWTGAMSMQKGPLWWASLHRHHHAHSDQDGDIHSPLRRGFWWAHAGWILCTRHDETIWRLIRPFDKFPELVWLNRYHTVPGLVLGAQTFLLGTMLERYAPQLGTNGLQMMVWGFLISTILTYHGTFAINSLAHVYGSVRYPTGDGSRNNFWLALLTCGEGWHNNHHHYPSSSRMGFRWWEVDFTHWVLRAFAAAGLVWDLKTPPRHVIYPDLRIHSSSAAATPSEDGTPSRAFTSTRHGR